MAKKSIVARQKKRERLVAKYAGISRIMLRQMANEGLIPGITKASW